MAPTQPDSFQSDTQQYLPFLTQTETDSHCIEWTPNLSHWQLKAKARAITCGKKCHDVSNMWYTPTWFHYRSVYATWDLKGTD